MADQENLTKDADLPEKEASNGVNMQYLILLAVAASLGGLLFGYDTAVIAGAIGFLAEKFELTAAMKGWTASSAIIGCIFGAMFAGVISDRFGRKRVLIVTAILFAISAIGSAIPQSLVELIGARFIGGLGVGAASMLAPLYISEISPAHVRGRLVTLYQLAIVVGIQVIYFVNLLISGSGDETWNIDLGWRYMFGSEIIPAILFLILLLKVPESPRWLAKQGRDDDALDTLTRINGSKRANEILDEIKESFKDDTGTLAELFKPGLRTAMVIGIMLALFSQITGINAIIYYAPEIFKGAGFATESAMMQTVIIGLVNLIFTFVALWLIDKLGRKKLLLFGISGMFLCLLGLGTVFYLDMASGPFVLIFILGYVASFASAMGPIPWVMISEIFPTRKRGLAISIAVLVLWFAVYLVTQLFPIMTEQFGEATTFWIFMINCIVIFLFVLFKVPETKGKTLEEIEQSWKK